MKYCIYRLLGFILGAGINTSGFLFSLVPLLQNSEEKYLPLPLWLPFQLTRLRFWILYIWEFISIFRGAAVIVSVDIIFIYYMMQVCAQFDILSLRLLPLSDKRDSVKETQPRIIINCINQHDKIFE